MIIIFIWESVGAIGDDFDDFRKFRAVLVGARFLFKHFWLMLYKYMGWVWGWIAFMIWIMIWESVGAIGDDFEIFENLDFFPRKLHFLFKIFWPMLYKHVAETEVNLIQII